jgi:hypothetical protein
MVAVLQLAARVIAGLVFRTRTRAQITTNAMMFTLSLQLILFLSWAVLGRWMAGLELNADPQILLIWPEVVAGILGDETKAFRSHWGPKEFVLAVYFALTFPLLLLAPVPMAATLAGGRRTAKLRHRWMNHHVAIAVLLATTIALFAGGLALSRALYSSFSPAAELAPSLVLDVMSCELLEVGDGYRISANVVATNAGSGPELILPERLGLSASWTLGDQFDVEYFETLTTPSTIVLEPGRSVILTVNAKPGADIGLKLKEIGASVECELTEGENPLLHSHLFRNLDGAGTGPKLDPRYVID